MFRSSLKQGSRYTTIPLSFTRATRFLQKCQMGTIGVHWFRRYDVVLTTQNTACQPFAEWIYRLVQSIQLFKREVSRFVCFSVIRRRLTADMATQEKQVEPWLPISARVILNSQQPFNFSDYTSFLSGFTKSRNLRGIRRTN